MASGWPRASRLRCRVYLPRRTSWWRPHSGQCSSTVKSGLRTPSATGSSILIRCAARRRWQGPACSSCGMQRRSCAWRHAEPVAFAADNLALAIAEIGALSERRIAMLIDASLSQLPTSANQGDHVSMATFAARRPLRSSPRLERLHVRLRERVPFYDHDRHFAPDIEAARALVCAEDLLALVPPGLFPDRAGVLSAAGP